MNLGELRLKALQSLKRPYSSTTETSVNDNINIGTVITETVNTSHTLSNNISLDNPEREEGEITDNSIDSHEEGEIIEDSNDSHEEGEENYDINSSNEYVSGYSNPSSHQRNITWIRRNTSRYLSDESDQEIIKIIDKFDLNSLINFKYNLLSKIDENQSILAASEEKELDLMKELEECRNLHKKCENEKFLLEIKLKKIENRINLKEKMKFDLEKEVSKNNYKKKFVSKMFKETYMRSFNDRFKNSSLFRIYNESLELDQRSFIKIQDTMTPFCLVELMEGKCPYYFNGTGTCSMQHIEEIMKNEGKNS